MDEYSGARACGDMGAGRLGLVHIRPLDLGVTRFRLRLRVFGFSVLLRFSSTMRWNVGGRREGEDKHVD